MRDFVEYRFDNVFLDRERKQKRQSLYNYAPKLFRSIVHEVP